MKEYVLNLLRANPSGMTPTQIGLRIGKPYSSASSSVMQPLKSLIKDGFVERIKIDNKVLYKTVEK